MLNARSTSLSLPSPSILPSSHLPSISWTFKPVEHAPSLPHLHTAPPLLNGTYIYTFVHTYVRKYVCNVYTQTLLTDIVTPSNPPFPSSCKIHSRFHWLPLKVTCSTSWCYIVKESTWSKKKSSRKWRLLGAAGFYIYPLACCLRRRQWWQRMTSWTICSRTSLSSR